MIVQTVGLKEVDDVESVRATRFRILQPKIEPLIIHLCVVVRFENQIIFKFIDLDGSPEVAGFEPGLKAKSIITRRSGLILVLILESIVAILESRQVLQGSFCLWIAVFFIFGSSCHGAVRLTVGGAGRLVLILRLVETIVDYSLHKVFLMGHSLGLPSQTIFENGLLVDVERLKLLSVDQVLWAIFQELVVFDPSFDRYDLRVRQAMVVIVESSLEAKELAVKIG